MNRLHATAFEDTQPYVRPRTAVRRDAGRARRRTVLTLACIAAGMGGGAALRQQPLSAKHLAVQSTGSVARAATAQPVPLPQASVVARAEPQAQAEPVVFGALPPADEIRSRLRWISLQQGRRTLDADSRLLLARSAAQRASLQEVGLDYRDVYGVIHAESSWVPREGMGRNGVASHGLAQFEPATARAVGLRNPSDPVEAVHAAAVLLKEAARWSARRLEGLNLDAAQRASKLREGISVYYNLSTRGRMAWSGQNSQQMPIETRLHIRNVRDGALRAGQLTGDTALPVASAVAEPAPPAQEKAPRAVVAAAAATRPTRTHVTFSGTPRRAPTTMASWVHTRDAISMPEGSIRWSSRETRPTGG